MRARADTLSVSRSSACPGHGPRRSARGVRKSATALREAGPAEDSIAIPVKCTPTLQVSWGSVRPRRPEHGGSGGSGQEL